MSHQNVPIVGWGEFHESFSRQLTELLAIHVKAIGIDVFEAKFFDGPLDPLSHMFFGPAQRI